ncbi:predicted protein [Botrytis cinerea T4]|uniref:Uncharacterized protein n=1 Tax=Botryotinia fuckeliana (strain T4) TaxID=999810 RepID=G2YL51_BOTF4|nr:predicted protein [Botrytis cinerea T4]
MSKTEFKMDGMGKILSYDDSPLKLQYTVTHNVMYLDGNSHPTFQNYVNT